MNVLYSIDDAAHKLDVPIKTIIKESAAGRLLVCFHYRGDLGIFTGDTKQQKPVCYFDGYLQSCERTSMERTSERWDKEGVTAIVGAMNRARPVRVLENLSVRPSPPALLPKQFYTRLDCNGAPETRAVPSAKWLFLGSDVLGLAPDSVPITSSPMGVNTDGLVAWQAVVLESWSLVEKYCSGGGKISARDVMKWAKSHGPKDVFPPDEKNDRDTIVWKSRNSGGTLTIENLGNVLSKWKKRGLITRY